MADDSAPPEGLLEQYRLVVEMADRASARRATANSFFLSVETALVGTVALADGDTWPVAVAGVIVALAWSRLLGMYRTLNDAKFKVIHALEEQLPARPFKDEWDILDRPDVPLHKKYRALSVVEQTVPWVFVGLLLLLLIVG